MILKHIYRLAQSHTVFSAFLSDLWWVRQDTITELCAKVLLSFLNCATILLKGKISVELPIEITSTHWHGARSWHLEQEKGDNRLDPKPETSIFLISTLRWLPCCLWQAHKTKFLNTGSNFPCSRAKRVIPRTPHVLKSLFLFFYFPLTYFLHLSALWTFWGSGSPHYCPECPCPPHTRSKDYLDWRFRCCSGSNGSSLSDLLTTISDWFFQFLFMLFWTYISSFLYWNLPKAWNNYIIRTPK